MWYEYLVVLAGGPKVPPLDRRRCYAAIHRRLPLPCNFTFYKCDVQHFIVISQSGHVCGWAIKLLVNPKCILTGKILRYCASCGVPVPPLPWLLLPGLGLVNFGAGSLPCPFFLLLLFLSFFFFAFFFFFPFFVISSAATALSTLSPLLLLDAEVEELLELEEDLKIVSGKILCYVRSMTCFFVAASCFCCGADCFACFGWAAGCVDESDLAGP